MRHTPIGTNNSKTKANTESWPKTHALPYHEYLRRVNVWSQQEAIMSEKKLPFVFIVLNLIILNGVVLAVLNLRYPLVGHDYTYAIPSFLDTAIHYRLNGLSIQWFTPTFGGGLPVFSNPNNMQFSIPAFLSVFLPPWTAVMVSIAILISAGFLACYYFLHHTLQLHWTAAILGAFFFSANGFVVTRAATGQL